MKKSHLQLLIFVQSLLAMLGSLYYSNFGDIVANIQAGNFLTGGEALEPCQLCWWARIMMYPIVLISFLGILCNDKHFYKYTLGLAVPGLCLELYHYYIQKVDTGADFGCSYLNPCNALKVDYFGFVTIPFLCGVAFLVILLASLALHFKSQDK